MSKRLVSMFKVKKYISKLFKGKNHIAPFFICLVVFIVYKWVRPNFIIATAEEGILFYDLHRTFLAVSSVWFDRGMGIGVPFSYASAPLFFLLSTLSNIGIDNYILQAILYFVLLLIPLMFIPKFVERCGGHKIIGYMSALVYLFNFFTETQIFNRFLYTQLIMWSLLPLFLYLWGLWIEYGKFKYILLIVILSEIFSYVFVSPSNIILMWAMMGLLTFYELFRKRNKIYICRLFLGFIFWLVLNLWWIFPIWNLMGSNYSEQLSYKSNFSSLENVSKYYDNRNILNLTQKYYFDKDGYFKTFYSQNIVNIFSKIATLFLALGVVISLFRKKNIFFVLMLLIGWFICKGTNPPFGYEFYSFMFKNFTFFQVFRNPYEKFGVVFLLAYSVLVSYGVYSVFTYVFKKKTGVLVASLLVGILCLVIGRPIFTGDIFYGYYYIKVPQYYEEANLLIKNHLSGRILHLPYRSVPNVKYVWNFQGEDISTFLFDNPSISGINSLKNEYDYFSQMPMYFSSPSFSNILNVLNVGAVVVHRDFVQDTSYFGSPDSTIKDLGGWVNLSHISEEGDLVIYKLDRFGGSGEVDLFDNVIRVSNLDNAFESIISKDFHLGNDVVYVENQNKNVFFTFDAEIEKPEYIVTKLSNRKYKIKIHNAQKPFILVLDNSFNKGWIASSDKEMFEKKFMANGYANGWLIDNTGDYTIDVVFKVWPWD